jgi:hypothetical protein
MNKITPIIFNGDWQLIMSETLCCDPTHELLLLLPITSEKNIPFRFLFKTNANTTDKGINIFQERDTLVFTLTNFLHALGASLANSFEFKIGDDPFYLQLYGISTGESLLCLTISIFRKRKVNA